MRYVVHYSVANERQVAQIEAGSPQEAVVKFRHTRPESARSGARGTQVLSVSPEPICDEHSW